MSTLTLSRPAKGLVTTLPISKEHTQIDLSFSLGEALFEKVGENLEISFDESGTKVILENFYTSVDSENLPDFLTLEGLFSGKDFFAALDESLMPAAGNETPTQPANDGLRSGDDSGAEGAEGVETLGQGNNDNAPESPEGQKFAFSVNRAAQSPADEPTSSPTPPSLGVNPPTVPGDSTPPPIEPAVNAYLAQKESNNKFYVVSAEGDEVKDFSGAEIIEHKQEVNSRYLESKIELKDGDDSLKILANAQDSSTFSTNDNMALNTTVGGKMEIYMGQGNDRADLEGSIAMYAKTSNDSSKEGNAINILSTEEGEDIVNLKATGNAMLANVANDANDDKARNEIRLGADSDRLTIEAGINSTENAHAMLATGANAVNSISAGRGADFVSLSTNGNESSFAMRATDNGQNEISLGYDDDTLEIKGALSAALGGQNKIIAEDGADTVKIEVNEGEAALRAVNLTSTNTVSLGDGNDALEVKGAIVASSGGVNKINAGFGADTITLDANTAANALLSNGGENTIDLGRGADDLTIIGGIKATNVGVNTIDLDKGDDKLEISGGILANLDGKNNIFFGDGNDEFILTGGITATEGGDLNQQTINKINLGEGDDIVRISDGIRSADGAQNTIDLGFGNDRFEISGKIVDTEFTSTSTTSNNTIDGGKGVDTLKLGDVGTGSEFIFTGTTANFNIKGVEADFKSFEKFEFSNANETLDFTNFNSDVTLVWTLDSFGGKDIVKGFDINKDSIDLTSLNLQNTDSIRVETTGTNSTSIFIEAADGTIQEISITGATFDKQDLDFAVIQGDSFIII